MSSVSLLQQYGIFLAETGLGVSGSSHITNWRVTFNRPAGKFNRGDENDPAVIINLLHFKMDPFSKVISITSFSFQFTTLVFSKIIAPFCYA